MHPDRQRGPADPAARARTDRSAIRALVLALALGLCALVDVTMSTAARADDGTGAAPGMIMDHTAPVGAVVPAAAAANEPLTAADKDLLVKVRLAGLWEMPAGQMAAQKGVNPRVRQIGAMIGSQHARLDALVTEAAKQVGVPLPNEPNADQQKWLGEMRAASGREFDQVFVYRLRAAHGKVFPAIANVRAGTRNSVVRKLAQEANGFVLTHLTLLESTGLVDYAKLPPPPAPSPAAAPQPIKASPASSVLSVAQSPHWYLWIVIPGAVAIAGWSIARSMQGGRRRGSRRDPDLDRPAPRPPAPVSPTPRPVSSYDVRPYRPSPYTPQTPVRIPADERLRTTPGYRP